MNYKPFLVMGSFFPIIFTLAILLSTPYKTEGYTTFDSPTDPMNIVVMGVIMAIGTAIILFLPQKLKVKEWFRYIFIGVSAYSIKEVVYVLLLPYLSSLHITIFSTVCMVIVIVLLLERPEWYVIDITAICLGAGAIASLGMSFSVSLTILLLIGMLIYDFIAVYKSKHMIQLANTIVKMRLPVIMIVPTSLPYTWLVDDPLSGHKAYFMGLGDLIFPGMLVVSSYATLQNPIVVISEIIGTLLGFIVVSYFVSKGKVQAGLPFLCTGVILGFVVSSMIIYGRLML